MYWRYAFCKDTIKCRTVQEKADKSEFILLYEMEFFQVFPYNINIMCIFTPVNL